MAKHRSAFQLLKEAQSRMAKLQERVAREAVSDHADIKSFDFQIKNVQSELTKARRYTNADNGLAKRIEKLEQAIVDAKDKLSNASKIQASLESQIKELKGQRSERVQEILAETDIDIESMIEEEL